MSDELPQASPSGCPATTPADVQSNIDAAEYARLGKEIERMEAERVSLLHGEYARRTGAGIGDSVIETERRGGRLGVISAWYTSSHWPFSSRDNPWVRVRLYRKDGTLGEKTVVFFDWKKAEGDSPIPPSPKGEHIK